MRYSCLFCGNTCTRFLFVWLCFFGVYFIEDVFLESLISPKGDHAKRLSSVVGTSTFKSIERPQPHLLFFTAQKGRHACCGC